MRRPAYHRSQSALDVQMTPMIDVVFLLMIYFVCTVTFHSNELFLPAKITSRADASGVTLTEKKDDDLPAVEIKLHATSPRWEVNGASKTSLSGVKKTLLQVRKRMQSTNVSVSELAVSLQIDGSVTHQDVIDVHQVCQSAKFLRVHVSIAESHQE